MTEVTSEPVSTLFLIPKPGIKKVPGSLLKQTETDSVRAHGVVCLTGDYPARASESAGAQLSMPSTVTSLCADELYGSRICLQIVLQVGAEMKQ